MQLGWLTSGRVDEATRKRVNSGRDSACMHHSDYLTWGPKNNKQVLPVSVRYHEANIVHNIAEASTVAGGEKSFSLAILVHIIQLKFLL